MVHDWSNNPTNSSNFIDLYDNTVKPLHNDYGFSESAFDNNVSTDIYTAASLSQADITSAITAASNAGGGIVHLPAGTGTISTRIQIQNNVLIEGEGEGVTILKKTSGDTMIFEADDKHNFVIRDMTLDGNNTDRFCINVSRCESFLIERVTLQDTVSRSLFILDHSKDFTVRYCTFLNGGKHGIGLKDCYEPEGTSEGTDAYCAAGYTAGTYGTQWSQMFNIYSNTFSDCNVHGLNNHGKDAEVCGNEMLNNQNAGKMFDGRRIDFHHNYIHDNTHGIMFNFTLDVVDHKTGYVTVQCNRFSSNGTYALYFGNNYNDTYDPITLDSNTYGAGEIISTPGIEPNKLLICANSEDTSLAGSGNYSVANASSCNGCSNTPPVVTEDCTSNILTNGDFATNDYTGWSKYTNGTVSWSAATGASVANITNASSNTQLSQNGISITAGKKYILSFTISSDASNTISVFVHKDDAPYSNLGLNESINVTTVQQDISLTFTALATESNARLRFWLVGAHGIITIDNVCLYEEVIVEQTYIIADFSYVVDNLNVTFIDNSTSSSAITNYLWNFGDGNISSLQNPTHTYNTIGSYIVTLTITSVDGTNAISYSVTTFTNNIIPATASKFTMDSIGTVSQINITPSWVDLFGSTGSNLLGVILVSYNIFSGYGQGVEPSSKISIQFNIDTGGYRVLNNIGDILSSGIDNRLAVYGTMHPIENNSGIMSRGYAYWNWYTNSPWPILLENQKAIADLL